MSTNICKLLQTRELCYAPRQWPCYEDYNVLPMMFDGTYYQKDIFGHKGCVNAIEFSHNEDLLASGGDDQSVYVWRIADLMTKNPKYLKPFKIMATKHRANVFAYEFSLDDESLYSGGNDGLAAVHDLNTGQRVVGYFEMRNAVYNIHANPTDKNVFAVTREDNGTQIHDIRCDEEVMKIDANGGSHYSGQYNPARSTVMAIACSDLGLLVYDLRSQSNHKRRDVYWKTKTDRPFRKSVMYACWNSDGTAVGVLNSGGPPAYFNFERNEMVEFVGSSFKNVQTIKSLEFIDDNTMITGSDNFDLFFWNTNSKDTENDSGIAEMKMDDGSSNKRSSDQRNSSSDDIFTSRCVHGHQQVLKGHRSIVNHVRYSEKNQLIVSSGVEKIVKLWSSTSIPYSFSEPRLRPPGSTRAQGRFRSRLEQLMLRVHEHDSEDNSMQEDITMLNYFDELLMSRGMNISSSDDSDSSSSFSEYTSRFEQVLMEEMSLFLADSDNESTDSGRHPPTPRLREVGGARSRSPSSEGSNRMDMDDSVQLINEYPPPP